MGVRQTGVPKIAKSVLRKDVYFDTVRVYVEGQITDEQLKEIGRLVGTVRRLDPMPKQPFTWSSGIAMNQPSAAAIRFIKENFSKTLLSRVDVALDFVAASFVEAEDLNTYLRNHLIQRWHGGKLLRVVKDTVYYGAAKSANNIALYADKPSRIDKSDYCVHLEWRINSSRAVRAAGFHDVDDLLEFNFREFWRRRLSLRDIPRSQKELEDLGKSVRGQPKRRGPWLEPIGRRLVSNRFLRIGYTLLRASGFGEEVKAQEAWDALRQFGKRHFPELPCEWLLPTEADYAAYI